MAKGLYRFDWRVKRRPMTAFDRMLVRLHLGRRRALTPPVCYSASGQWLRAWKEAVDPYYAAFVEPVRAAFFKDFSEAMQMIQPAIQRSGEIFAVGIQCLDTTPLQPWEPR